MLWALGKIRPGQTAVSSRVLLEPSDGLLERVLLAKLLLRVRQVGTGAEAVGAALVRCARHVVSTGGDMVKPGVSAAQKGALKPTS